MVTELVVVQRADGSIQVDRREDPDRIITTYSVTEAAEPVLFDTMCFVPSSVTNAVFVRSDDNQVTVMDPLDQPSSTDPDWQSVAKDL